MTVAFFCNCREILGSCFFLSQTFQTSNYFHFGNSSSRQPLSIPQHFLCRSKQRLTRRIAAKHPQVLTLQSHQQALDIQPTNIHFLVKTIEVVIALLMLRCNSRLRHSLIHRIPSITHSLLRHLFSSIFHTEHPIF